MEEENDTQDWNEFIKKVKTMFSNKSKIIDTEWKIETFQQKKNYIMNFMINFKALVMKAETNNIHTIFLLKKNIKSDIIKTILRYLPIATLGILKE